MCSTLLILGKLVEWLQLSIATSVIYYIGLVAETAFNNVSLA